MHPSRQRGRDPQQKSLLPARTAVRWQAMCHPPEDLSAAAATDRSGSISSLIADLAHVCSCVIVIGRSPTVRRPERIAFVASLPEGAAAEMQSACFAFAPAFGDSRPIEQGPDSGCHGTQCEFFSRRRRESAKGPPGVLGGFSASNARWRENFVTRPNPFVRRRSRPSGMVHGSANSPTGRRGPIVVPSNQPHSAWRHCDVWRASGP